MGFNYKPRHAALVFGGLALAFAAGTALADSAGKWTSGKEVYDKVCGYCHKPNPGLGPVLTTYRPDDIRDRVRKGHRPMPAFRQSEIDDQALAQLIEYIRTGAQ